MITRTHTKGDAPSTAIYSDCEKYRYSLTRIWDADGRKALFVMLNPSTATDAVNYALISVLFYLFHIVRKTTV